MREINFKQYESERLYPLGFQFKHKRGKQSIRECEIVDYAITHNSNGQVVQFRYVVEYPYMGQTMREGYVQTTIDIATDNAWKELN